MMLTLLANVELDAMSLAMLQSLSAPTICTAE